MNILRALRARIVLRLERARARYPLVDVVVCTFQRHGADYGSFSAAALTFYMFFSIFPLLLFALSALGYLSFLSPRLKLQIIETGRATVPMIGSILHRDVLEALSHSAGVLALTGLLLGLYSGSEAVGALSHALNRIHRLSHEPRGLEGRLKSLRWLGVLATITIVSVAVSSAATLLGFDPESPNPLVSWLGGISAIVVGVAISTLLFVTAFKFLPARNLPLREVLPGALAAAIAFEALKVVGSLFLRHGTGFRLATFGAFAASAGLLVACYVLAQVTLLAAEVNATLVERERVRQSEIHEQPREPDLAPAQGGG